MTESTYLVGSDMTVGARGGCWRVGEKVSSSRAHLPRRARLPTASHSAVNILQHTNLFSKMYAQI